MAAFAGFLPWCVVFQAAASPALPSVLRRSLFCSGTELCLASGALSVAWMGGTDVCSIPTKVPAEQATFEADVLDNRVTALSLGL